MSINLPGGVITLAAYAIAIPAAISARLTSAPRKKSNSFGDIIIPPAKNSLRLHFSPDLTDPAEEHQESAPEAVAPAEEHQEPAPEAVAPAEDYQEPTPEAVAGIHGNNATKADRAAAALKKAVKKAKAQKVSKAAKEVGPN